MASKLIFHTSRLRYLLMYLIVIALLLYALLVDNGQLLTPIIILCLLLLIIAEILVRSNDLIMQDNGVVNQMGILSKKMVIVHYSNISDVTIDQSFIQRILGIGDVHINTSGSERKEILIRSYANVNKIHDIIVKNIHLHKRKR